MRREEKMDFILLFYFFGLLESHDICLKKELYYMLNGLLLVTSHKEGYGGKEIDPSSLKTIVGLNNYFIFFNITMFVIWILISFFIYKSTSLACGSHYIQYCLIFINQVTQTLRHFKISLLSFKYIICYIVMRWGSSLWDKNISFYHQT